MPRLRSRVRDSFPAPMSCALRSTPGSTTSGGVAEWSCSGLQSRGRRFDSDPRLQDSPQVLPQPGSRGSRFALHQGPARPGSPSTRFPLVQVFPRDGQGCTRELKFAAPCALLHAAVRHAQGVPTRCVGRPLICDQQRPVRGIRGAALAQGPRQATGQGASPTGSEPLMDVAMSYRL